MGVLVLAAVFIALLFLYTFLYDMYCFFIKNIPPGPFSLPILGSLYKISPSKLHINIRDMGQKYGPIMTLRLGAQDTTIFLNSATLAKKLFMDANANDRPSLNVFRLFDKNTESFQISGYGTKVKHYRRICRLGLNAICQNSLEDKMRETCKALLDRFETGMNQSAKYDPFPDLHYEIVVLLLNIMYGDSHETLTSEAVHSIINQHRTIIDSFQPNNPLQIVPFLMHIPNPWLKKLQSAISERDIMFKDKYFKELSNTRNDVTAENWSFYKKSKYFLSMLLDERQRMMKLRHGLSTDHLREMHDFTDTGLWISTWGLVVAGMETTLLGIMWTLLALIRYPEHKRIAQEEIDRQIPDDRLPTSEDKQYLPYTEAIVLETMRLYPGVQFTTPHKTCADIKLDAYTIPKGSNVMANIWAMHRDPDYWTDPETFDPRRFLNNDNSLKPLSKLPSFQPWSTGRRSCLGDKISRQITIQIIASILHRFELESDKDTSINMEPIATFTLQPQPFNICFTKRTQHSR